MRVFIEHSETEEMIRTEVPDGVAIMDFIRETMKDHVHNLELEETKHICSWYKVDRKYYEAYVRAEKTYIGFDYDFEICDITPTKHSRDWISL